LFRYQPFQLIATQTIKFSSVQYTEYCETTSVSFQVEPNKGTLSLSFGWNATYENKEVSLRYLFD